MADVITPDGYRSDAENALDELVPSARGSGGRAKNWAEDERVRTRLRNELVPLVNSIRSERSSLNQMWRDLLRVWTLEHDEQKYHGDHDIYVPAGRKSAETLTSQLTGATFPGDDYFGVESVDPNLVRAASDNKLLLQYRIEKANVRMNAERFYRQLVLTGNAPVKMHWRTKKVKGVRRSTKRDALGAIGEGDFTLFNGPVFETLDIGNFYMWPEDVNDPADAIISFEDMTVSASSLREKAREGCYVKDETEKACAAGPRNAEKDNQTQSVLNAQGLSSPHDRGDRRGGWGLVDITEVYTDFDPTAASKEHETHPVPFLITLASSGEILRAIRNPFWHQQRPYLLGRMGTLNGRVYGTGFIEAIRQLNLLLNAHTNQGLDCVRYALNPIILTNPNAIMGALPDLEPGVQFLVNDVNQAVKFVTPPMEPIQALSVLSTQYSSWIQDYSGSPPVLSGGSAPGRAFRTATGIEAAQRNATIPLNEIVKLCEAEVWEPLLFHFWALDQQFADDEVAIRITGSPMTRVRPADLAGDWTFRWLASSQAANQQVKGSQITQLLSVLSTPGLAQMFQQNGLRLNPAPLIKRLYQEVFGFRDVDQVILKAALGPPAPEGMTPEVGGGQPPSEGQSLAGNMDGLGEQGDFAAVRENANGISAALGGLGLPLTEG